MPLQLSDNLTIKLKAIAHRLKKTTSIPTETASIRTAVVTEFSAI